MIPVRLVVALVFSVGLALGVLVPQSAAPAAAQSLNVFFSRHPDSDNDFSAVFPLPRNVPGTGLDAMRGAIQALIAGPTAAEQAQQYFSDFANLLVPGPSTCKGFDFLVMTAGGIATVQLCHATSSAGIGQDARAQAEIEATLMQFPGVQRVRVLNSSGHCLFDQSGLDLCLQP